MGTASLQNIDVTKAEHEKLTKQVAVVSTKIQDLIRQIDDVKAKIVDADARYSDACLAVAAGKQADPHAVQTERANLGHKLNGLEQLLSAARTEEAPLITRIAELVAVILNEQEREQEAQLVADQVNRQRAMDVAHTAYLNAQGEFNDATNALAIFRQSRTAQEQRRLRGQG